MTRKAIVEELHKPARRNIKRRKVIVYGIDDLYQADLVDMRNFSKMNKGHNYILTVINAFSKYAYAEPLKTKSAKEVSKVFEKILKKSGNFKNLQTDDGREFFNSDFQNLMKTYKINHYSTYSVMKASIVERFNRTLKENMWKNFSLNGNYKYLQMLPELIKKYNNTKHRTINMKPKDVNKSNEKYILENVYNYYIDKKCKKKKKFKKGDNVRISKYKHLFEKGYTKNWTGEIFIIDKVKNTCPVSYVLRDSKDNVLLGRFYEEELSKTKYPNIYLIEKIIKKKKNKIYVKWLGFDKTHNSWVDERDYV